ncbi:MAG: DUF5686 and carboxypeptidase regulatory-like domain-containing protein [Microscillaceae bacterium]|jgi:hypothetical protein|nr:DUF5686 and carboxypeptidase regulatory-like domain-containing protein [Microscillaceae bacterium]
MKYIFSVFLFINLLIISLLCVAQTQNPTLRGIVIDADTKQPLPFVNITINEGLSGTTSDIDGRFTFTPKGEVRKISFSYVGYETFVYSVNSPADLQPFALNQTIKLFSKSQQLAEIVVRAGENPAHRLIRLAVQNRNRNNPEKIASFSYLSYHKFYLTGETKPTPTDSIVAQARDSMDIRAEQFLEKQHLFLTESVTERKYIAPSYNQEKVLANRVSGFRNPSFASVATDFQPFSFYQDFLTFFNKNYLNPMSKGSTEKYQFTMIDTVLALPDTVYIIQFKPLPDKNFDGLVGTLYLNTKHYAIEAITAASQTEKEDFVSFKIQQKYEWIADSNWFPTQMHADFTFHKARIGQQKTLGIARSYLKDIQIKPPLRKRDFSEVTQEIVADASQKPTEYWQNYRPEELSPKESKTYQYLDSLGQKYKFDRLIKLGEILSSNRVGIKKIDLDFNGLLRYNRYEGFRLGAGGYTNDKLSPHYSLGAYVAYGTRDGNFKYGASASFNLWQRFDVKVGGQYFSDVFEPGMSRFLSEKALLNSQGVRNVLTERMDKIRQGEIFAFLRPLRNTRLRLGVNTRWVRPAYTYQFALSAPEAPEPNLAENFRLAEFTAQLHYAFGQEFLKFGNRKIFIQSKYPVISLNYARGGKFLGGEYEYNKLEINALYTRVFRNLGTSTFELFAGQVLGDAPYSVLFNGRGTTRELPVVVNHYFQTMEMYEFLNDRFVNFFLSHNFGKLLFRPQVKWFQPELVVAQAMAWGSLQNPTRHRDLGFLTMERGYFESGLLINNLLRFNYLDTAYFGIGIGAYIRYGNYARNKFSDNTAFKMTTSFSF